MFSLFSNGFQNLPAAPHDTLATRVGILSALTKPGCRVRYSTTQSKEIISENTKVCDDDHISVTESALLSGVGIAVPASMKSFPMELLPQ
jgi:hypothetical protein